MEQLASQRRKFCLLVWQPQKFRFSPLTKQRGLRQVHLPNWKRPTTNAHLIVTNPCLVKVGPHRPCNTYRMVFERACHHSLVGHPLTVRIQMQCFGFRRSSHLPVLRQTLCLFDDNSLRGCVFLKVVTVNVYTYICDINIYHI